MEKNTVITETNVDAENGVVTVKSSVEEKLTEADVRQNMANIDRQMFGIRQQMTTMKQTFDGLAEAKAKYQAILDQMVQTLPEITQ